MGTTPSSGDDERRPDGRRPRQGGPRRRNLQRRAREKAAADGTNFTAARRALDNASTGDPDPAEVEAAWNDFDFPSLEDLVRRELSGALLQDVGIDHPNRRTGRSHSNDVWIDVDLPARVDDVTIAEMIADLDTLIVQSYDEFEGGTKAVQVEVNAELVIHALVRTRDLTAIGPHTVFDPGVDPGWTQVEFNRSVTAEYGGTVDVGSETVELDFLGAAER